MKLPDAVLAILVQIVLGVAIATSAVPQSVLSVQDRGSEVIGVLIVLIVTAVSAIPFRDAFGRGDLALSEYVLVVLTPLITRLDLGLFIWVRVNKALIWADSMLYATKEELSATKLLTLACSVWHNGDDHTSDVEFGSVGGEAAVLMYKLHHMYHPRNAGANIVLWVGHLSLWPLALLFHGVLQVIWIFGFSLFYVVAHIMKWLICSAHVEKTLIKRGSFWEFIFRSPSAQSRKLFMTRDAATLFDSNQHLLRYNRENLRHIWAMLANIDALVKNQHYNKLFDVMYPMRARIVLQRAHTSTAVQDIFALLNKEQVFFRGLPDSPITAIGEQGSRQVVLYRLLAWPPHSTYADQCLNSLIKFSDYNTNFWRRIEKKLSERMIEDSKNWEDIVSEFISIRDVVRRILVQIILLAFSDGLGECYLNENHNVGNNLADSFLEAKYMGLEMSIRLASSNPRWMNAIEYIGDEETNMLAAISVALPDCPCSICKEIQRTEEFQIIVIYPGQI